MMQAVLPRTRIEEFAIAAAVKREEYLRKEKDARHDTRERQRRKDERTEDARDDMAMLATMEIVLASTESVAEFRVQLDEYDAATVEALMENQVALDAVRERIRLMLEEAHVLEDGRRVFKTKDGTKVYDEYGQEVPPEVIDPDTIADDKPKWEDYKEELDEYGRLAEEREQLLDYQRKLDEARERLDQGEITQDELDTLKADLAADMPDAVRVKLGLEKPQADAAPTPEVQAVEVAAAQVEAKPALPSNMDDLMQKTGLSPGGPSAP